MTAQNRELLTVQLAGLLGRLDSREWPRLERLLAKGEGGTMYGILNVPPMTPVEAQELMTAAIAEMEHDQNITAHRKKLHEYIGNAQTLVVMALGSIEALGELGDPEYMGGVADLEAFLHDAGRALRTAQKIKPTDKDGNA